MAVRGNRKFSWVMQRGQDMVATTMFGHDVQNWSDPDFARRILGRIRRLFQSTNVRFNTVLTMKADDKTWDSLRKYLGDQPRVRIANPRRGESPMFYVLLTHDPPENTGRLVYVARTLATNEEVFDLLQQHLVVDAEQDIVAGTRKFNKYSTNIEELKVHQNRRRSTTDPDWQVKAGSARAWKKYADDRGATSAILSDDKNQVIAKYPPGHDQTKFQLWPGVPSGDEVLENEEDATESEVTND